MTCNLGQKKGLSGFEIFLQQYGYPPRYYKSLKSVTSNGIKIKALKVAYIYCQVLNFVLHIFLKLMCENRRTGDLNRFG